MSSIETNYAISYNDIEDMREAGIPLPSDMGADASAVASPSRVLAMFGTSAILFAMSAFFVVLGLIVYYAGEGMGAFAFSEVDGLLVAWLAFPMACGYAEDSAKMLGEVLGK